MVYSIVLAVLAAYFLGNLNGAVCISAIISDDDVRKHGSGNAGLTNFIRNYGASKALLVVAVDAGKAVLSCLLGALLLQPYGMEAEGAALGGAAVMLGHACPILLGFRGGKGILSGVMVALMLDWRIGLLVFGIFLAAYLITGYVSLGSVLAAGSFGFIYAFFHWESKFAVSAGFIMGAVIVWMHRGNIIRLFKGEERKTNLFGKGKKQ